MTTALRRAKDRCLERMGMAKKPARLLFVYLGHMHVELINDGTTAESLHRAIQRRFGLMPNLYVLSTKPSNGRFCAPYSSIVLLEPMLALIDRPLYIVSKQTLAAYLTLPTTSMPCIHYADRDKRDRTDAIRFLWLPKDLHGGRSSWWQNKLQSFIDKDKKRKDRKRILYRQKLKLKKQEQGERGMMESKPSNKAKKQIEHKEPQESKAPQQQTIFKALQTQPTIINALQTQPTMIKCLPFSCACTLRHYWCADCLPTTHVRCADADCGRGFCGRCSSSSGFCSSCQQWFCNDDNDELRSCASRFCATKPLCRRCFVSVHAFLSCLMCHRCWCHSCSHPLFAVRHLHNNTKKQGHHQRATPICLLCANCQSAICTECYATNTELVEEWKREGNITCFACGAGLDHTDVRRFILWKHARAYQIKAETEEDTEVCSNSSEEAATRHGKERRTRKESKENEQGEEEEEEQQTKKEKEQKKQPDSNVIRLALASHRNMMLGRTPPSAHLRFMSCLLEVAYFLCVETDESSLSPFEVDTDYMIIKLLLDQSEHVVESEALFGMLSKKIKPAASPVVSPSSSSFSSISSLPGGESLQAYQPMLKHWDMKIPTLRCGDFEELEKLYRLSDVLIRSGSFLHCGWPLCSRNLLLDDMHEDRAPTTALRNAQMKRCAACDMIGYCSKEHQHSHWPHHRKLCRAKKLLVPLAHRI